MNKIIKRVVSAVTAAAIALTAVFVFNVPKLVASAAMSVPMGDLSSKGYYLDANYNLTIANDTGMENWHQETVTQNGMSDEEKAERTTLKKTLKVLKYKAALPESPIRRFRVALLHQ